MKTIYATLTLIGVIAFARVSADNVPVLRAQPNLQIADGQKEIFRLSLIEYAKSANFHSGGFETAFTVREVHGLYRELIASGRFVTLSFEKPFFLSIAGNRNVTRDMFVDEIVFGFSDEFFPTQPFLILSDGRLLKTDKCSGDLALKLSAFLEKPTKREQADGGNQIQR